MPMVGDCVPQPTMLWYPVGVPLSYHHIKRLKSYWSHMNKNYHTILQTTKMAIFHGDFLNNN